MKLSIVVPFYKCRASAVPLYERLLASCEPLGMELELVFVEDCGGDGSWEILEEIARGDNRVKAVQLSRNYGQHHALTAGLDICTGDWVVTMDCDLQDRPEDIPGLFSKALEGYDVVCTLRTVRKDPLWKRLTSRCFRKVFGWCSGIRTEPGTGAFRLLSKRVVEALRSMREQTRLTGAHIRWLGFSTGYVAVEHDSRFEGKSSYSLRKLLSLAWGGIAAYSSKPLRLPLWTGFFLMFISCLSAVGVILRKLLWGIPADGAALLMISLWFLGGLVIFNIGIVGLYVGKVFDETKRRPLYVISRSINL